MRHSLTRFAPWAVPPAPRNCTYIHASTGHVTRVRRYYFINISPPIHPPWTMNMDMLLSCMGMLNYEHGHIRPVWISSERRK